ncbi:hypothetical protein M0R45_029982 [Rubus argutus]|uniref:Uncharacterized protein n=1 Tax=Rubus argutus TaxID=59490 RepID=A0AAW1WA34_RUBAR
MGMRLGLGLASAIARDLKKQRHWNMKKISRSSCSAAVMEEKKKGGTGWDEDGKSLYLFFAEQSVREHVDGHFVSRMRYPIRSIKLSYLLSPSLSTQTDDYPKLIEAVPTLSCSDRPRMWGFARGVDFIFTETGAVGPKFTRTYRKSPYQDGSDEIRSFETQGQGQEKDHHRNPKLKNSPKFKMLKKGEKEFLFLDALPEGKVYCLCPYRYLKQSEVFQVLDTTRKGKGSKKWLPLEAPPAARPCFTGVTAGSKFLLWYSHLEGVYCFDVTQPEKGWLPTSPSLGSCIPFLNCIYPLVVEHEHHGNFLMFTFDPQAHDTVQVFLMSQKCDTLQALNQPLVLPELPWNIDDSGSPLQYQFVHLGPQTMCLVLHQFFHPVYDLPEHLSDAYQSAFSGHLSAAELEKFAFRGRNKGDVLLITFEYEIINLDIQYRLLTTRHLEYTSKRANRRITSRTKMAMLAGAAVL